MDGLVKLGIAAIIVAALSAGAYGAWHHYEGLVADLASAEKDKANALEANKAQDKENKRLHDENVRLDAALTERRAAQIDIDKLREGIRDDFKKLAASNPEVAAWMAQPIPPALLQRLRPRGAAGPNGDNDGARPAPQSPAAGNSGTGLHR